MTYAAAGDTWGLSGPAFLLVFLGLAAVLLVGTVRYRARLIHAPGTGPRPAEIGPYEAAYLNGGIRRVGHAALGRLCRAGTIRCSDGSLEPAGPPPADATPLERAVEHAARDRPAARALTDHPSVARATTELVQHLERTGLAVPEAARRTSRLGPALLLGLAAVGAVRVVAGVANDRPVAFLVLGVIVLAVLGAVLLPGVPRATAAGRWAVSALRDRNQHLRPSLNPAYTSYGASALALAVALYGSSALWVQDSSLAYELGAPQLAAAGGGGGAAGGCGGGGGGCGGCGGCGG